ncbi:hypothetical protein BBP40_005358 [Aspergillus hancockii]|nr:hypothetical protein BBP40_005358 [Aspergillus hancockii]
MKVHLWSVVVTTTSLCSAFVIPTSQQALNGLEVDKDANIKAELLDDLQTSIHTTASDIQDALDDTLTLLTETLHTKAESYLNYPFDDAESLPEDITEVPPFSQQRPPHHSPSDKTIYELITESKYTTILAKIINEDEELVHLLNSTKANYTLFAPTDEALKKIPHHPDHKPSKELIRAVLKYHLVPGLWDAASVFHSHTLTTELESPLLGDGLPQRLAARVGWRGLSLNYYSHLVPTHFSTLNLALSKTDLTLPTNKKGLTIFAPSNSAFAHLGLKLNAFLFSPYGQKYLAALLKYHIVPDRTLYSDVLYNEKGEIKPFEVKGYTHLDLPTLLRERTLAIDVGRFGPYASFRINGVRAVAFADVLGRDGNLHILDRVLIPPRKGDLGSEWEEDEVEELKSRLADWVEDEGDEDEDSELWAHGFEL